MGEVELSSADGVIELVNDVLRRAIAARASDVHFEPTEGAMLVRVRVDALLHKIDEIPAAIAPNVIARLKVMAGLLTYRTDIPQEGAIARDAAGFERDLRIATFPTVHGERVVARVLSAAERPLELDGLGLSRDVTDRLRAIVSQPQGLLVVCGPAGSGKTTTLFALLATILRERAGASVISVEDPAEIRLHGLTQVELAPARGFTYAVALRSLLRQDPQVLMVGEIRDEETVRMVVEAALTGHLLLTTIHSGSPAEAIVRMREMGVPAYQLTSTLSGVLSQRLVRTVCRTCGGAGQRRAECRECLGTGFAGRTAIAQLVHTDDALRRAILDGLDSHGLSELCGRSGSLRADAGRVLGDGRTIEDEVQRVLGAAT